MAYKNHEFTLVTRASLETGEEHTSVVTFKGNSKQMLKYLERIIKDAESEDD